jgi:hypothetical protein
MYYSPGLDRLFAGGRITVQIVTSLRVALFLAITLTIIPVKLGGQEQNLLPHSSPDVLALYKAHSAFINLGSPFDPLGISEITSPDSATLKVLEQTESTAADYLGATADLLAIYENLQSEADRTIVKPLLADRLRLYSRLLGLDAEKAAIPIGYTKQPATAKRALKLRDDILAAKNKVDTVAASL